MGSNESARARYKARRGAAICPRCLNAHDGDRSKCDPCHERHLAASRASKRKRREERKAGGLNADLDEVKSMALRSRQAVEELTLKIAKGRGAPL